MRGYAKHEWRWVLFFALGFTLWTSLPYAIGFSQTDETWFYNGFTFAVTDGNSYLGKIRLGAEGRWDFYLFYTPEDHEGRFGVYLPYLLWGQGVRLLAKPTPSALLMAFHLWRAGACFSLVLTLYAFAAHFLPSVPLRRAALILTSMGGGLGWLLVPLGVTPAEFYIPEAFSFLSLYGLPHLASGRALFLLGFLALFRAYHCPQGRPALAWAGLAGLAWVGMGLMVTFYWALLYVLLAVWLLSVWGFQRRLPWRLAGLCAVAGGLTLPLFAYNAWLFSTHEPFRIWSGQNDLPSPAPWIYLAGYGLMGAGAGLAWPWLRRRAVQDALLALLPAWLVTAATLVYAPLSIQRRLSEGAWVCVVLLALIGLRLWAGRQDARRRAWRRARGLLMALSLPAMPLFWLATTLISATPACNLDLCLYRPQAEIRAMLALDALAPAQARVMSSAATGNFLPLVADVRPFVAHGPETRDFEAKQVQAEAFLRGELDATARQALIEAYGLRYIWYGPLERALAPRVGPWAESARLIYDRDGYAIYEIVP